jgi:hypothetical protein
VPEATAMDQLVLGPDAAYSVAAPRPPETPPQPPKPPPRVKGDIERGLDTDLRSMPLALRRGTLARTARSLAQDMDDGGMTARDKAGIARELRMVMAQLNEMTTGERKGDTTDEVRERRERRLAAGE